MSRKGNLKDFLMKYRHAWVFLYGFIYMPWFTWLEQHTTTQYYVIHSAFDSYIPFVEYFVIPYLLWFAFMFVGVMYFFFTDRTGFYRLTGFLIMGMTLFLVICTVFPNGLSLRPTSFARDNVFVDLVRYVYSIDTPTNVLPSLHVFNSLGVAIAVCHSDALKKHRAVQTASVVLTVLIILSTMFLKQHSVVDVIAGCAMACVLYPLAYSPQTRAARETHLVKHTT